MAKSLPKGCFPTMITPFLEDGAIDYATLDCLFSHPRCLRSTRRIPLTVLLV
jgi:hypothetical protein